MCQELENKKQEVIQKYILRKIAVDDLDFIFKTADNFEISPEVVDDFLKRGIFNGQIEVSKERKCGYKLVEKVIKSHIVLDAVYNSEDRIFKEYIEAGLINCNSDALRIWQYACEEMLNNVIEHSNGKNLYIEVYSNVLFNKVLIVDDGVGAFHTLVEYMRKNGWTNPQAEDALLELYKGKITSKGECHSGEGIFFSSKLVDSYVLWSDARIYECGNGREPKVIKSHLLAYASKIRKVGTMVSMSLENETQRKIAEVFDMYTDIDDGFIKTRIPIKEACINGDPVARSQARRICNRLEEFKEVILDFTNVEFMGQGFSDEIFRVYAQKHPEILIRPINMIPAVERMVKHVGRGMLSENVILG